MRTIEISQDVWEEIAKRGKFGETEDDVLRRVFSIPRSAVPSTSSASRQSTVDAWSRQNGRRRNLATQRMSSFVQDDKLVIEFHGGARKTFALSDRSDRDALRRVRDQAVAFARASGASYGQEMAVKKALTEAGYYLLK